MTPFHQALARARLYGFLPVGQGVVLAGQLAGGAARAGLDTEDARRAMNLAAGFLRQELVFMPWRDDFETLADLAGKMAPHPEPFARWLGAARTLLAEPEPETGPEPPDPDAASADELADYCRAEPRAGHRFPALLLLWQRGERDAFLHCLDPLMDTPSGALAGPLLAWGALAAGEPGRAEALLDHSPENFLGHALRARLDRGHPDRVRDHLRAGLACEPEAAPLALQLKQAGAAPEPPDQDLFQRTAICLYSWNKLDTLLGTLKSLAGTRTRGASVTLLNNGSDQFSPEELERAVSKAAPGLDIVFEHLPVNIGAPAARNWLMRLDRVRERRYLAFLDDDVLLPGDWLEQGLAALRTDPDACVAGPKGIAPGAMRNIQYVWRYFEDIGRAAGKQRIRFTPNAPSLVDLGQYDLVRPSLTVMGCCHVLDTKRLNRLRVPDFDIRFSPSQVDDIEHDMQVWLNDGKVIYTGHMEVVHLQDTGGLDKDEARLRASRTQAWANHTKLEGKFSLEELTVMNDAVIRADDDAWS